MLNVNTSVLGRPADPEELKKAIDAVIAEKNPLPPRVGELYVQTGLKFGIHPLFAASQAIYETGWFRFGGQVDASWHNPAGLKCEGRFVRFNNWEEGIHAHYERLNCYVRPADTTGEGGKYDPCYGHWRYYKLIEMGKTPPDRIINLVSLWSTGNPYSYAQAVVNIMQTIANRMPVPPGPPEGKESFAVPMGGVLGITLAKILLKGRKR